jgi:hypothetical protein
MVEGVAALNRGYSKTPTGQMRFPVSPELDNVFQIIFMGQYSTPTARFYFKEGLTPLGAQDTAMWEAQVAKGVPSEVAWVNINKRRITENLPGKYTAVNKDSALTPDQKASKRRAILEEANDLKAKLDEFAGKKSDENKFGLQDLLKMIQNGNTPETPVETSQFDSYTPESQTNPFSKYAN